MATKNRKWILFVVLPIVILGAAGTAWHLTRPKATTLQSGERYQYVTIQKGNIQSVVTSTGTLAPISEVSVLSQMSGTVEKVNVNYNDQVRKGEVLAELNTNTLRLQEMQQNAAVSKAQATYNLQLTDVKNKTQLAAKGLLAAWDLASSETALDVDAADLASAQAALKVIQLQIDQYAKLTSPIDGIVLDMNVQVGQSVVDGSSSNATSLFTLAEDLNTMEIEATVDELDISSIKPGQQVSFTVDANPGTTYSGKVKEIHLVPTTTDNVVNYYVIINAENPDGTLLPGMTANIRFIKENRTDVLVVPNAALRFTPPTLTAAEIAKTEYIASLGPITSEEKAIAAAAYDQQQKEAVTTKTATQTAGLTSIIGGSGMGGPGGPGGPGSTRQTNKSGTAQAGAAAAANTKYLWYLDTNGKLTALKVTTGASDGTNTEITSSQEIAGKSVILKIKVEA
ncbi:MAG TPA: efflux RND transporter periplasmic adaptor subunit [Spirochaetia bacterium]|nr:efflux RND transporter periplasmic adaptor subunit [Spirochaetia bacterium]